MESCAVDTDTECPLCSVLTERAKRKESQALPAAYECKNKGRIREENLKEEEEKDQKEEGRLHAHN